MTSPSEQLPPEDSNPIVAVPTGLVVGALYPLRALMLLVETPSLRGYVIAPIVVNVLLGGLLYVSVLLPGWHWVTHWTRDLPGWLNREITALPDVAERSLFWVPTWAMWLDDVLQWVLAIGLFVLTGLLLVQFGAIFGAPWYGALAEQIERHQMGQVPAPNGNLLRALQDIWRAITFQIKKLGLFIVIGIPLLLLNFLPIPLLGNSVASFGGMALAAVLMGLDFIDPPLERRRFKFRSKLCVLVKNFPTSASFCLVCLGLVSIPLLNLLAVPICVIAGTLFCCDRVLPKMK